MIINYFKVPFITAFSIDDYIESLTLGIAPSGEYIEGRVASDSFTGYLTGFNRFFSGSGYWLTSGSTYDISTFLSDAFSGYASGTYQYASLNGGFIYQQYVVSSGATTGNLYLLDKYTNDSFSNYATGGFTGSVLTGNVFYNSYSTNTGATTGNLLSFTATIPNSGSLSPNWLLVNQYNISTDAPFVGARSYYTSSTGNAFTTSTNNIHLGDYTIETWIKGVQLSDLGPTYYGKVIMNSIESSAGFDLYFLTGYGIWHQFNNTVVYNLSGLNNISAWNHIAVIRTTGGNGNLSGANFCVNGTSYSGTTYQYSPSDWTGQITPQSKLYVGGVETDANNIFTGYLAEFRLWNYARSQTEIQSSMNSKINPAAQTGLLLYLSL